MTTTTHPAHGPVSLDRLHQISEILSKAAQSDGGNLGYAMADAVKVIDEVLNAEPVAYMHHSGQVVTREECCDDKIFAICCKVETPLYAAPQLPQPEAEALKRLRSIVADPKTLPRRKEWISGQQYSYVLLESVEAMVDDACRAAMLQDKADGNYPVIGIDLAAGPDRTVEVRYFAPPGYVMVPKRLTDENGAKNLLVGEFSETKFINCPECFGDDECETCDGSGRIEISVPVSWTNIKAIWAKGVEHFAAAPKQETL